MNEIGWQISLGSVAKCTPVCDYRNIKMKNIEIFK